MPNLTANLKLRKPTQDDTIDVDVLNENFDDIDASITDINTKFQNSHIGKKSEILFGTYTGDGEESRVIDIGFTPTAVEIYSDSGEQGDTTYAYFYCYGGLAINGFPCKLDNKACFEVVNNGFKLYKWGYSQDGIDPQSCVNEKGVSYYFKAYQNCEITEAQ